MRKIFIDDGVSYSPLNARRSYTCLEAQITEMSKAYSNRTNRIEDLPKLKELYSEAKVIFDTALEDYKSWNKLAREIADDLKFNQRRESTLDRMLEDAKFEPEDRRKVLSLALGISDAGVKIQDLYIQVLNIMHPE